MTKNIDLFHDIQFFLDVPVEFSVLPYAGLTLCDFFKSPLGLYLSDCTNMMIMSHYGISVVINVRVYDSQDEFKTG